MTEWLKKILLWAATPLLGLGVYAGDARWNQHSDVVVLQVQSYEYCQKILDDLREQMAHVRKGSPEWLALEKKLEYYKHVCGMK